MTKKFIILSNSLRDQRGHYYETSIALAEAARRAGWKPVLATHVECHPELLPDWLECYPVFCTDHWMAGEPCEPPDLGSATTDPYAARQITIEAVERRDATIGDFVASRFGNVRPETPRETPPSGLAHSLRRVVGRSLRAYHKATWITQSCAFYALPPCVFELIRWLARWLVPPLLCPAHHPEIIGKLRELAARVPRGANEVETGPGKQLPTAGSGRTHADQQEFMGGALANSEDSDSGRELDYAMVFKRDLERLLALTGAARGDHVVLGTAHARELLAVHLVVKRLGPERSPTFHLEFRHPLFHADATDDELSGLPAVRLYRAFFELYENRGAAEQIRFYTDTEELSRDYERLSKSRFGILPIPFRSELIEPPRRQTSEPVRLAYLGEARDEKGFPWLPALIDDLNVDGRASGKIRFLIQASLGTPQYNPESSQALDRLREYPRDLVELYGVDKPLTDAEYYELLSNADVALFPYDRHRYGSASSGTLADAIGGGRPVIVPSQTWLSRQLSPGAGETFHDYPSFVAAVRSVVEAYDDYARCAQAARADWLRKHNADAFVAAIARLSPEDVIHRSAA